MLVKVKKCQKNAKEVSRVSKCHEFICYLQIIMNKHYIYKFRNLAILIIAIWIVSCSNRHIDEFQEVAKVSLRDVGHKLLLLNKDSTSLVKPVRAIDESKYKLSFEKELFIHPDSLVVVIKRSFKKADLPQYYLTEVIRCEDNEVAYSYEMNQNIEKGIVPCGGRQLPKSCYTIQVRFTKSVATSSQNSIYTYLFLFSGLLLAFVFYKRATKKAPKACNKKYASIGSFQFYPEQNKLVKKPLEIGLSKKECELLEIFVANPNQIIKRDELTKRVWEDNGVIVGRSLDTYISKLRKKLKADDSIKLTNVHGIGYKLEID